MPLTAPIPTSICVMNKATLTSTTTVTFPVPLGATSFIGYVECGTVTGTSPTLDIQISQNLRKPVTTDTKGLMCSDGTLTNNILVGYGALTQITSSTTKLIFAAQATGQYVVASGFPSAGTFRVGPVGDRWTVSFTIGGTSPSFADVIMVVQFL